MDRPFAVLARIITGRPYAVAGAIAAIFFVSLWGMTLLSMETGTDTYMDKSTERGMLLDKYTDTFSTDMVMLIIEADDVTNPEVLAYIDRIEADIGNEQYIAGISSIVDLIKQINNGQVPKSYADIILAKESLPPYLLERYLPSELLTISVITLEPGVSADVRNAVLDNIDAILRLSDPPPGVGVTVTGDSAFEKQMGEEIGASMGVLISAAMLLMILAVGLLFSHVRYRLLPVAVVACGLILTFGIMGIAGIPISMVVIGAFPVLIGIGIDYAIQFHTRFDEESRKSPLPEAILTTLTRSGPAILFAMIATSLGFIAMYISPVPMVQDFGLTCTIGVVSCYIAALVMVPTFGTLIAYRPKEVRGAGRRGAMDMYDSFLGTLALKIAKHPLPVVLILGFVAIVGIQIDQTIPINTNEDTFVPPDMPAVVDLKKVTRTMGSTQTLPVYVRGAGVLDIDTLSWIKEFSEYEVSSNDKVTGATSIVTYLMQYNGGVMPSTDAGVEEVLARIPRETKNAYVSGTMDTVIQFSLMDMENEVALSLVDRISRDIVWKEAPPGITVSPTGQLDMFTSLIDQINQGKTRMTLLGFGLIFAFLLIVYRRLNAISPLIPIMMIVGWNGAIMYLLGIEYSPMTAALGSMTIGVASEYTILIMERSMEERDRGRDVFESIRESVQKIGTAVTVSGMTTVFGFSALLLSTFNIIKNFGAVTVITVGFSLIGAIIVMPAVLSLMGRGGRPEGDHAAVELVGAKGA
ncbi:MAG: hydrogenase expression protein HypA [Methanoculleus sp. SDB]|nr:MAG: hydrogenase expression protein HypA [Methanoculleus sp. SDB]